MNPDHRIYNQILDNLAARNFAPLFNPMNHKDERIRKLYNRGITDPRRIANKIGYCGSATDKGIERVKEAFGRLGFQIPLGIPTGNGTDSKSLEKQQGFLNF